MDKTEGRLMEPKNRELSGAYLSFLGLDGCVGDYHWFIGEREI